MEYKSATMSLKQDGPEGSFLVRFATLGEIDKDGDRTLPGAFPSGKEVLVSSYMHGSWGGHLPVGKATIREVANEVLAEGQFNLDTATGREHYAAVKFSGHLQEWSYGFIPLDVGFATEGDRQIRILKKVDPYEISPVLRGAGVDTATLAIKSDVNMKGAIPSHSTGKAAEDADWDAGEVVREAEGKAQLRLIHAWVNEDADPEAKSSYKLPHHYTDGKVVWRGTAAAMAALLGARGGVELPSEDKKGVYSHLERHYKQFDKEPPELRGLWPYGEHAERLLLDTETFLERTKALAALRLKEGRVLSAANREKLAALMERMTTAMQDIQGLLDSTIQDEGKATRVFLEYTKLQEAMREMEVRQ